MQKSIRYVGLDVHAETIAVAVAETGGEVRSVGTVPNTPDAVRRLIKKLGQSNACQACNPSFSTIAWYQAPSHCARVAAYVGFSCAVVEGAAKCWGSNQFGRLGVGQPSTVTPNSAVALAVSGLGIGVQAVSSGSSDHACALVNGGVKCWGKNNYGALGDGSTEHRNAPVQVSGLTSSVSGIATGSEHSCALVSGQVRCWGNNSYGQLGSPTTITMSTTPIVVVGVSGNVQSITLGFDHSCALADGKVYCWGSNSAGQLGNNSTENSPTPLQVSGVDTNVEAIAAGGYHTCAVSSGGLRCWGSNSFGQLGDNTTTNRWAPVSVQGMSSGVLAVSAGYNHTCAILNGGAQCWGNNGGRLGDGTEAERWAPVAVQGLGSGVQAISAGNHHTCSLTTGGAKCWGHNWDGELGSGSTSDSLTPVSVQGL